MGTYLISFCNFVHFTLLHFKTVNTTDLPQNLKIIIQLEEVVDSIKLQPRKHSFMLQLLILFHHISNSYIIITH